MEQNNSLKRQLNKSISVEIIPTNKAFELTERIWAINWFDYKSKWLYTLYNKLAAKYVIQVGGQLLFKGHNQRTLLGEKSYARKTLLIVTYPTITNFLDMLLIKTLQLVGLLRVKAVKDFVFGFTKRLDDYEDTVTPKINPKNQYLVFHYQGKTDQSSIIQLAHSQGLTTYFIGEKLAQIKRSEIGKEDVIAPFFMDGIMVFDAQTEDTLNSFVDSADFTKMIEGNSSNYAAIFTRVK